MERWSLPLCTLPPGAGPPRFVCYCEGEGSGEGDRGGFSLYVTDAAELWSTHFTPDSLAALKAGFGLSAAEDITPRFRAACEQQAVALTLQEDRASLTLSGGPSPLAFDLSKVPGPEAAPKLQALTLDLAQRVCSLERRLAAAEETAASPRKSSQPTAPQLFLPGCGWDAVSFRSHPHPVSPRPRSPERWPRTWSQEALSGGVSHQPWLQE
ncbi:protein PAXX isoform X1 [Callithrix jacchus]|uniref:protein PAXX isoform X1 n=1 Tax=Callithrix jacchus TaxID=9483 RepID=UPI00083FC881|nr:protein PAXX isoform X1 [Callithrix jacchus]